MKNYNLLYNKWSKCLFLILTLLFVLPSCSDILEENAKDFLTTSNSFNTPEGVAMGITGLHDMVKDKYYCLDTQVFGRYSDVAYAGEGVGGFDYSTDLTAESSTPQSYWAGAYDIIQQANLVLDGINGIDDSEWTSDSEKNIYIAEAKFFRAYAYRFLVYLFGGVPIQTEPVTSAKTDFVRAEESEVYELIESDLLDGTENLPTRGNEEAAGRITQGTAWHLLSEIYLAQEEYQNAVDAASHVINDYGYALMTERFGNQPDIFGSENVYFDLFTIENQNLSENTETIWALQFEPDVTGTGEGDYFMGPRAWGCAYFRMGTTPDGYTAFRGELYNGSYTGYSDTLSRPVAWARPTYYVTDIIWQSDWDNDYRNTEACIKRHFYFDNPNSAYHGKLIDWDLYVGTNYERSSAIKDTCQYIFPYFMKIATPCVYSADPARSGGGYTDKDFYVFRLAETYLLRAEGYLGLGETGKAADDINTVRNRSNASSISASDVTIDYILDERARELYTEEFRLLTLMRLGKMYERTLKYNDDPINPGLGITEVNNIWPIPQTEIDLNTGATLEQNPGY